MLKKELASLTQIVTFTPFNQNTKFRISYTHTPSINQMPLYRIIPDDNSVQKFHSSASRLSVNRVKKICLIQKIYIEGHYTALTDIKRSTITSTTTVTNSKQFYDVKSLCFMLFIVKKKYQKGVTVPCFHKPPFCISTE